MYPLVKASGTTYRAHLDFMIGFDGIAELERCRVFACTASLRNLHLVAREKILLDKILGGFSNITGLNHVDFSERSENTKK